jgi:hypothetical protein
MRTDLPRGDAERPRERVARRIELARSREDTHERLLRGILRVLAREKSRGEAADEGPQPEKEGLEDGAIAPRERGQLVLESGAFAGIHVVSASFLLAPQRIGGGEARRDTLVAPFLRSLMYAATTPFPSGV